MSQHGSLAVLVAVAIALAASQSVRAAEPEVIELTPTGCLFLESERGVDRGFAARSADDCNRTNAESGAARRAQAKVLEFDPGTYIFAGRYRYACPLDPTPSCRIEVKA